ncbi:MAG: hypothetical protein AAGG51_13230 [Cyanobacteria bacterium P01_G01_bin.54]
MSTNLKPKVIIASKFTRLFILIPLIYAFIQLAFKDSIVIAKNSMAIGHENTHELKDKGFSSGGIVQADDHNSNRDDTIDNGEVVHADPPDNGRDDTLDNGGIVRDPSTLAILTPRNGNILGDRLTLRWSAVEDVTSYTIFSENLGLNETVESTIFDIPIPPGALNPNETYTIEVSANISPEARTEASSDEKDVITFNVLPSDKAAQVCNEIAAIGGTDERARVLAIADLFNSEDYQLNSDAMVLLETYGQESGFDDQITEKLNALYLDFGLHEDLRGRSEWTMGDIACNAIR